MHQEQHTSPLFSLLSLSFTPFLSHNNIVRCCCCCCRSRLRDRRERRQTCLPQATHTIFTCD